ncbi:chaperone protein dnaJ 20, chloroplastic-like [Euphorbia lathyris]|uniref:chaperone protein dnaJ 20, chloroplastic-like n=1 Tax=Euphorbia lathyris TaxID=212925 RepID=UPI0033136788
MSIQMISIGSETTFNLSSIGVSKSKTFLNPSSSSSHLKFNNTNFPKQNLIPPMRRQSKSSSRIKASAAAVEAETVYLNTESTLYELLGISESGTLSEIKNAYRQLARKYHPDVSPADKTEEYTKRFLQVQEAYETLSDPESRASYDRDMARGLFNGRKGGHNHVGREEWEDRWQSQLEELIRSSNDSGRMSWGARMRSKRCST